MALILAGIFVGILLTMIGMSILVMAMESDRQKDHINMEDLNRYDIKTDSKTEKINETKT